MKGRKTKKARKTRKTKKTKKTRKTRREEGREGLQWMLMEAGLILESRRGVKVKAKKVSQGYEGD